MESRTVNFTKSHLNFINELYQTKNNSITIQEWDWLESLKNNILDLKDDPSLPIGIIRKLRNIYNDLERDENIILQFNHGDFTPWNCYFRSNTLGVYDWELGNDTRSLGFDYFHFKIQTGILVERLQWDKIYLST